MTIRPQQSKCTLAFFGTEPLAEATLSALEESHFMPALVVASPDVPDKRTKVPIAPFEKQWAEERGVPVLQPHKLSDEFLTEIQTPPSGGTWDLFIVASYGKILPKKLLDIPAKGVVNVHPSLLPRLRGPSPMRSAILSDERDVGVSIMLLDEKMDHGPLLAQRNVAVPEWPPHGAELDALLAREGAQLLVETLPQWLDGNLAPTEQDHTKATFCKLFTKEDGLVRLDKTPYKNFLKIRALEGWPGAYTFFERKGKKIRVAIIDAHMGPPTGGGKLILDTVRPEGKGDMPYEDFVRSGATPVV